MNGSETLGSITVDQAFQFLINIGIASVAVSLTALMILWLRK